MYDLLLHQYSNMKRIHFYINLRDTVRKRPKSSTNSHEYINVVVFFLGFKLRKSKAVVFNFAALRIIYSHQWNVPLINSTEIQYKIYMVSFASPNPQYNTRVEGMLIYTRSIDLLIEKSASVCLIWARRMHINVIGFISSTSPAPSTVLATTTVVECVVVTSVYVCPT